MAKQVAKKAVIRRRREKKNIERGAAHMYHFGGELSERGFYLNYPDDLPGDVYETQQALTAYLKSPEKDTLTEKYDQFIEKYMGACDGHSSERIAAMINQYMEEAKHE